MFSIDSSTWRTTHYSRDSDGHAILAPPVGILLHSSEGTRASDLPWLTSTSGDDPGTDPVSCHLYVQRDASIFELAPDTFRTWHAGSPDGGAWHGIRDGNRMIGIECEHKQGQDWPADQVAALRWLCQNKITQYHFAARSIGAHRWYAPSRKLDPTDWADDDLRAWIAALFQTDLILRVVVDGAHIREAPSTKSRIVASMAIGTTFWSDERKSGEVIAGDATWWHYAGPDRSTPAARGWVSTSVVDRLA